MSAALPTSTCRSEFDGTTPKEHNINVVRPDGRPGVALTKDSLVNDPGSDEEINREELLEVYPTPLNLSMNYQRKR